MIPENRGVSALRSRQTTARSGQSPTVVDEARQVAKDLELPPWWLNEQATAYISGKDDPGKRRVFDHPGLRVMAASPGHVFAMKDWRPGQLTSMICG